MPNRVIRDSILTSRQVARLDWFQQALFVRLILGCDDYGRYYGAPDIICGHLFSTSSGVTQELVAEGLGKLEEEGLIVTYQVEEETYCALPQWSKYQVCRTRREKFPPPPFPAYRPAPWQNPPRMRRPPPSGWCPDSVQRRYHR